MIKNIIFDLSEVIISGYHGMEKLVELNTDITAEQFLERKSQTLNIFLDTMRGYYSEEQYWNYILDGTNWNITVKDLKKLIRENLNIPVAGTMDIIKKLLPKYNLILLSDHVKEWAEYIFNNNKELNIFKHIYFSYQYVKLKSDEDCFKYVLKDLNIKPEETVFIDDYIKNTESASKIGIYGIVFKNSEQLESELKKIIEF